MIKLKSKKIKCKNCRYCLKKDNKIFFGEYECGKNILKDLTKKDYCSKGEKKDYKIKIDFKRLKIKKELNYREITIAEIPSGSLFYTSCDGKIFIKCDNYLREKLDEEESDIVYAIQIPTGRLYSYNNKTVVYVIEDEILIDQRELNL